MAEAFDAEVARRPRLLVVDLPALRFIDSSALSVLMRSYRALHRDGGTLALVDPPPAVALDRHRPHDPGLRGPAEATAGS
jgi:anti-anti-sigma factor